MEGRREEEQLMFETSHLLGAHLASSPLLPQAWRQCGLANAGDASFVVEQIDGVLYVAFSGVLSLTGGSGGSFLCASPIEHALFSPLAGDDGGEPVLVNAFSLSLFLAISGTPEFQTLVTEARSKAVIFTGHSIGGSLASLAALHCLCSSSRSASPSRASLLCITFGGPLLGNESLSRAVLRERWGGNFCHVVTQHDVMPRLLFCPPGSISPQLVAYLLQSWRFAMRHPQLARPSLQSPGEQGAELRVFVAMHIAAAAAEQDPSDSAHRRSPYRPFGGYVLCSTEGAVCIDGPAVVVRMLYLTFVTGSVSCSIEEEHLSYGDLVVKISHQLLMKKRIDIGEEAPVSNHGAGISLALEASGIGIQDRGATDARECLKMSKNLGRSPNLNCANLAIRLARITPCRAQIEWYKAYCDDDMGYYDSFKRRKASRRESKVNMNRIKLAQFWDDLVDMLRNNQLPHDFQKRGKWVNASHFYKLLVEPLDIAEYYRGWACRTKGHYLTHGRERRYEVFDRWWRDEKKGSLERPAPKRSKFAGLTQDSCFWAKVEEAKEWVENARTERNPEALVQLCKNLNGFESYARQLVETKEVSHDVLAPRSSYRLWVEEWKDLKLKLDFQIPL